MNKVTTMLSYSADAKSSADDRILALSLWFDWLSLIVCPPLSFPSPLIHTHTLSQPIPFTHIPFLFFYCHLPWMANSILPAWAHCHHVSESSSADILILLQCHCIQTWAKVWWISKSVCRIFLSYVYASAGSEVLARASNQMYTKRVALNSERAAGVTNWWAVGWRLSELGKCEQ